MAAPFSVCTKEEQSDVVRFLRSEGIKGVEIDINLYAQYGNNTLLDGICVSGTTC
jgi:hypothetical protein